jgi:site-specific recombinase XerD
MAEYPAHPGIACTKGRDASRSCSEPRLSFSKTGVVRYRMHLESRHLAPGTINLRLGAVRRLEYEAVDCGLLSADSAAGIRRVKGVKKLGIRLGNWLTPEQAKSLWQAPDTSQFRGKRDRALLSILVACGLRRHEVAALTVDHLQQREGHWRLWTWQGRSHSDHPSARLGLQRFKRLDAGERPLKLEALPKGEQRGQTLG